MPLFNRIYFYLSNEVYAQVKHMKAYKNKVAKKVGGKHLLKPFLRHTVPLK